MSEQEVATENVENADKNEPKEEEAPKVDDDSKNNEEVEPPPNDDGMYSI